MINNGVLNCLNDRDLVRMLDSSNDLTEREMMLLDRLSHYTDQESPQEVENRLEKSYESALEQSEFRSQLIEQMLEASKEWPKKYHKILKDMLDNSYVEI